MEFDGTRTLKSLIEEEKNSESPTPLSFRIEPVLETDSQLSSARPPISFTPLSPESPWTLSPINKSPSSSILYYCVASLHSGDSNIFSIAVSKGVIFTGSDSDRVLVWRQPECVECGYLKTNSGNVRALLSYGNMLFTTHKDFKIRIWIVSVSDQFRSKKFTTLPKTNSFLSFPKLKSQHHKDTISCLAYYKAEGLLYTGSSNKAIRVWRVTDKLCIDSFVAHEDGITAIVINQHDGCVFTSSLDGSIKIWRRVYLESSHILTMTLRFQPSPINAMALSGLSNSAFLYSGSSDGFVNLWEKEAMSGIYNHGGFLQGHRFAVLCLVTIESLVFSGSQDMTIRVWRREKGSGFHMCLAVLEGHRGPVRCLAACLEVKKVVMGFLVYSGSLDRTVKVWRIKVPPEEKVSVVTSDMMKRMMEYEMSPVLSPSWVKKKLQGIY
ncbi:protein JINGUBANG-like [Tasmannia lanceolata]|uniref:protein JINGUBANG-like n=1 Tax=Tasmannia lanceolata TaxID=3420 RepID=UPI0040639FCB